VTESNIFGCENGFAENFGNQPMAAACLKLLAQVLIPDFPLPPPLLFYAKPHH
jgi:hypothetical protein